MIIHKSFNPWRSGLAFACALSISACGAAPDGMETAGGAERADTVANKLCDTCDPSEPKPKQPSPARDRFDVHIAGMWVPRSCDTGWEGDVAEVYWEIRAWNPSNVWISTRSEDHWVPGGPTWPSGYAAWIDINATREVSAGIGQPITIDATAWDDDDGLGDDWMGNVIRPVRASEFNVGQTREWIEFSRGGQDGCEFELKYDVTYRGIL